MAKVCTEEMVKEIEQLRDSGMLLKDACEKLGTAAWAYYNFKARGRSIAAAKEALDKGVIAKSTLTRIRKAATPLLVNIPIPEKRVEGIKILIGDPNEIKSILDKLSQIGVG